jgi:hypothetical protein
MSTLRATNIQHADAAAVGILLAADGTVGGLRPTQNTQTGIAVSLALTDSGRTVTLSNAAAVTVTVPAQATVAWNAGETVSLLNLGVGTVTVVAAAGVTINGTPLTLATSKGGSLVRTASDTWTFTPTGGGGGKVLQVVSANFTGGVSTTSDTFVTTNVTATITPSLSTSKVLIMANLPVGTDTSAEVANYTLFRGTVAGTNLMNTKGFLSLYSAAGRLNALAACNFLDSPATTSAQTYTIGMRRNAGASTVSANFSTTTASIILMEVAA